MTTPLSEEPAPAIPAHITAKLNPEQHQAVTTLAGPLMVVAGPGSGKTRVLTHRVAALVSTGVQPYQILAVTFTNNAAKEMRSRVADLVGEDAAQQMWVTTFHSMCARMLRTHHALAGLPRHYSISDSADVRKILVELLHAQDLIPPELAHGREKTKFARTVASLISYAKNHNVSGPQLLHYGSTSEHYAAAHIYDRYVAEMRRRGSVDFDDLLLLVEELLRTHPEVRSTYQNQFRHVLVDEFQDTNEVQWAIIKHLTASGNLCIVGDPDQSIYAFRGAAPNIFAEFAHTFPHMQTVRLEQNYRSTQSIVAASQAVISQATAEHRANMRTSNPAGKPVRVVHLPDGKEEAAWVVERIKNSTKTSNKTHAILVRTNVQTREFETQLLEQQLPFRILGALRFYDRAVVKDALAYLKLAVNPQDFSAFERASASPRRGIGPSAIAQVREIQEQQQVSVLEACQIAAETGGRAKKGFTAFCQVMDNVIEAAHTAGPVSALAAIYAGGLKAEHKKRAEKQGERDNLEHLDSLAGAAAAFTPESAAGSAVLDEDTSPWDLTVEFLTHAALLSSAEQPESAERTALEERVTISTMHAAKGKEWDKVFVVGVEEGKVPHSNADTDRELEEERRLFFVALSRAREELTITHTEERWMYNEVKKMTPSPYLDDLPDDVEHVTVGQPAHSYTPSIPFTGRTPQRTRRSFTRPSTTPTTGNTYTFGKRPQPASRAPGRGLSVEDIAQLKTGSEVEHKVFGIGKVEQISGAEVLVRFGTSARNLSVTHAPLKLVRTP